MFGLMARLCFGCLLAVGLGLSAGDTVTAGGDLDNSTLPQAALQNGATNHGVILSADAGGRVVVRDSADGDSLPELEFPASGLVPKAETGADRFLTEYPTYDGGGVVVAIFDTGVDPGAPGMQETPDGRPKIIDVIDGSGSGDVDTSTEVSINDGVVMGVSGEALSIPQEWQDRNPSGLYRVGAVRAFDLYPGALVNRLKGKRREKWDEQQRQIEANLNREIAMWKATHPKPNDQQEKELEDLELRPAQLEKLQKSYEDLGPLFDCVLFNEVTSAEPEGIWWAAIDTNEDGQFVDETLMTDFKRFHQFSTFSEESLMNYAVNIYEDGDVLSIVADTGGHGTHVAGIVGAYFPDQPELNGVAPGVQFISVKIGDTRIRSSSTGTGEIRGCVAVLEHGADLINMSYGGPTEDPNGGDTMRIYRELVNKHNVIFVSSAGNSGPALSTVGSPGGTTDALLGIGAYISPEMMQPQYAMREKLPEIQYTWSSRGPTYDGDLGVVLSAPGGSVSPIPNWSLRKNMLMNGTSMSSPNCCGGIALLLSACKQAGIAHSPYRVRRALENTARFVDRIEPWAQGRGLIQIPEAFEYLKSNQSYGDEDLRFEVLLPQYDRGRGLYLREDEEFSKPFDVIVVVTPEYHEEAPNREKLGFDMRFRLVSTVDWLQPPPHMQLAAGRGTFDLHVDPTQLMPGAHYGEVQGIDTTNPARGPVFRVPVTAVRPDRVGPETDYRWKTMLPFAPGDIDRVFLTVPEGATWADLRVTNRTSEGRHRFMVHAVQLVPGESFNNNEFKERMVIEHGQTEIRSFPVVADRTMELALSQYWSSLGNSEFECELTFHGLDPSNREVFVDGDAAMTRLAVSSQIRPEVIDPSGSLDVLRWAVAPSEVIVEPLGSRDLLPEGRQVYQVILEYPIKLEEDATITPRPAVSAEEQFSESFQSQLWMIFDKHKRLVHQSIGARSAKLDKGDYTLRMQVRHYDAEAVERLKDMRLLVDQKLSKSLSVDVFDDPDEALAGKPKFSSRTLDPGEQVMLFLRGPEHKDCPKGMSPGDQLVGKLYLGKKNDMEIGEGRRPGGYEIVVSAPIKSSEKKEKADKEKDDRSEEEKLAERIRDEKVKSLAALRKAKNRESFDRLAAEVLAEKPEHLPVLLEQLQYAEATAKAGKRETGVSEEGADDSSDEEETSDDMVAGVNVAQAEVDAEGGDDGSLSESQSDAWREVISAADTIIGAIDETSLAAYFGKKHEAETAEEKREKKEREEQKKALIDALAAKAAAQFAVGENVGDDSAFEETWARLKSWTDVESKEHVELAIDRAIHRGELGRALKLAQSRMDDGLADRKLYEGRLRVLEALSWPAWIAYEKDVLRDRFPGKYRPF
jgi:tripeptidyl-peptidase-2